MLGVCWYFKFWLLCEKLSLLVWTNINVCHCVYAWQIFTNINNMVITVDIPGSSQTWGLHHFVHVFISLCLKTQGIRRRDCSSHTVDKTACCRRCTTESLCWESLCLETSLIMWSGLKLKDLVWASVSLTSPGSCCTQLFENSYRMWGMCCVLSEYFHITSVRNSDFSCFFFFRFKSSALSCSRIHRSHPVPPALRLIYWLEHIQHSGGGAHLRPASLWQPWYQRYLVDVGLLLLLGLLGPVVLCCLLCRNMRKIVKEKLQ